MSIDFNSLKGYLPDYLREEFGVTNTRRNFTCPICGRGNNTPCASYDSRTERIKCFSCDWTGDIFDLVSERENVDTAGAVKIVSERFSNRPVKKYTPAPARPAEDFSAYIERCSADPHAADYFMGRGISAEVVKRFSLGLDTVKQLAIIPYSNGFYIGRYTVESPYKYERPKGAAKTEPFNSARLLDQTTAPLWICEGEINALSLETLSLQAVALGSSSDWRVLQAFAERHRSEIVRPLMVCLDNDEAGNRAQADLSQALQELGLQVFPVAWPLREDINDQLRKDGKQLLEFAKKEEQRVEQQFNKGLQTGFSNSSLQAYNAVVALDSFLGKVQDPNFKPTPTGFPVLDQKLGGGLYSGLALVAAAPSEGKTTFTMQICENIAERDQRDILVFSFEMSREQLIAKTLSRLTYEGAERNANAALSAGEFMQSYKPDNKLEGAKIMSREPAIERYRDSIAPYIYIVDDAEPTTAGVIAKIEEYERIQKPGKKAPIVLVDYLQLLDSEGKEFVSGCRDITLALKQYAITRDTIVFAISAVNRDSQRNGTSLTSSYGSSFAEYSSDYMLTIDFTAIKKKIGEESKEALKQKPIREMTVTIQKNRMGSTGDSIDFYYAAAYNHFTDKPNERELAGAVAQIRESRKGGIEL